jgi:hypothetical protein
MRPRAANNTAWFEYIGPLPMEHQLPAEPYIRNVLIFPL